MKNKIILLVAVLFTAFVLVLIWPALQGDSEGYDQKPVNIPAAAVVAPVPEPVEPEPVAPEPTPEPAEPEPTPDEPAPAPSPTVDVQTHTIKAQVTAYNPLVIFIQPGDQVAWSNMNGHDTQSLEGMIPEGAEAWHSAMGDNYSHTFTVEGVYFYKCTPHWGTGMGGVIVVGNPTNMDVLKTIEVKGAAKRLMKKAVKAIDAHTF